MAVGYQMRSIQKVLNALYVSPRDLLVHEHCLNLQMGTNLEILEEQVPHSVGYVLLLKDVGIGDHMTIILPNSLRVDNAEIAVTDVVLRFASHHGNPKRQTISSLC